MFYGPDNTTDKNTLDISYNMDLSYKMDLSIFKGKKIMFYGPGNTSDKNTLDISYFDYIIITNNMVELFFNKYGDELSCKIIHLVNTLYSLTHLDIIKKYSDKIEIIISIKKGYNYLKSNMNRDNIYRIPKHVPSVCGTPLGLSRILMLLDKAMFKELYITGVTFYSESKIEECYENTQYIIKQGYKYNIFNADKKKHDLQSNITYTKKICNSNKNITICKDLQDILYK